MQLTVLGCNGPFPGANGACSGYLTHWQDADIAIDLGCGTLPLLTAQTAPESLAALMLTHWHSDHCSDVLPLLYRLESLAEAPLHVYAPVDAASPVRAAVQGCRAVVLHDVEPGSTFCIGDVTVQAFKARHPVPALMYRMTGDGRTFAFTGDTNTVDGLTELAQDADLLLADGLFPASMWDEQKPHLSAEKVAQLAVAAHARQLIVTHLNPTIDPVGLLKEARAVFPKAELAVRGGVYTL